MSGKDHILLTKLKDGVQDTVVFLRMLEQFKIPAVMETRRKKLLEKLLNLQGDTIREAPPSYEDGESPASPNREVGELDRKSSFVDDKVSEYVRIQTKAKQEMSTMSPSKAKSPPPATIEEEKLEPKPEQKPEHEPVDYLEPSAAGVQRRSRASTSPEPERPASTISAGSVDSKKEEAEQVDDGAASAKEVSSKKKRFGGGLKGIRNKIKIGKLAKKTAASTTTSNTTTTELAPPQAAEDQESGEPAATAVREEAVTPEIPTGEGEENGKEGELDSKEGEGEVEDGGEGEVEVEVEAEEGVKITSELEKRVAKRFGSGFNWIKIVGKLKDSTLTLTTGNKEKQVELGGCMVSPSDAATNGIELFSHKDHKQWVFQVESKELREQWIEELQKAIDECPTEPRPPAEEPTEISVEEEQQQEKPDEEVPEIKVEPAEGENDTSSKKKRGYVAASPSRSLKGKPVNEIPEQGIQIKGYVHRKKGTFGGWERAYGVVTYAAIYFTSGEEVREYHHVCLLCGSGTVKHEKKGHDRQSEGLLVKSGKNKEMLSLAASEVQSWKQVLEDVLGVSQGNLELGSEDEDEEVDNTAAPAATTTTAAPPIEEDLYEELPETGPDGIDEDIYEEFDEIRPPSPTVTAPTLPPPRQDQKSPPSPALPPRNEPSPALPPRSSPVLPPRSSPIPTSKLPPMGVSVGAKGTPPSPAQQRQQQQDDDELYEDVVGTQSGAGANEGGEELYEDVVSPPQQTQEVEEVYDDVVGGVAESPTEDYTVMDAPQGGPSEEYVLMERGPDEHEPELYVEVDQETPRINSVSLPPRSVTKTPTGGTKITKPPPPVSYVPKHAGTLSRKAPKKSRFYEEWCAVEGTDLCVYKSQKDKRAVDKLSLSEFDMAYNPGKDGKFAFRLTKGDKVHHFSPSSKEELTMWISTLRGHAKSATLELPSGEEEVYETTADHTAESDEQISFKAGSYIRIISRDTSDLWIGQLGTTPEVFTGKIGKFPASKVTLAEDLYI